MRDHAVSGVIHLAAGKAVEESVADPLHYYRENVGGFVTLLEAVVAAGVRDVVLSSSAAVYGTPATATVSESSATVPESPYGETKLADEWLLRAVARAHGQRWAALRYFNVVGAGSPALGDLGATNLVPKVFAALDAGRRPVVYGDDYPTRDGTCVRDYVHVVDLAAAHVRTLDVLRSGADVGVVNIGTGQGATVREVLDVVSEAVGRSVDGEVVGRRAGDPAQVVGEVRRAREVLGWHAGRGLRDMVGSAWRAWRHLHPLDRPGAQV